jgi:S-(hydroxymethyl)glutathione dehydrogenase / alcohol dehydrogenase
VTRAAVLPATGADLEIREITLPPPGPGQVRVRLAAAGVCHSDLSLATGVLRQPVPAVLGHEGAGTVVAVGPDVTRVAPGDPVLLNWAPACRACHFCGLGEPWLCAHATDAAQVPYATLDGTALYPGLGTAAFAEETVVPAAAALPVPAGLDPVDAALLGCAVLTGYGAVHNAAGVRPGQSAVVIGLGGVGLSVLQALRIAGADPVIAVDAVPAKEALARACGATEFLVASEQTAREVRARTGGHGADHAFECVGRGSTIRLAWSATRRGGAATVVGIGAKTDEVRFSALELFHFARTLRGCVFGNTDPERDVPVLADHVRAGQLRLADLVTDRIGLDDIPAAFDRMRHGVGARSLVVFAP